MNRLARLLTIIVSTMSILATLIVVSPTLVDAQETDQRGPTAERPTEQQPVRRSEPEVPDERPPGPSAPTDSSADVVTVEGRRTVIPNVEPGGESVEDDELSEDLDESTTHEGRRTSRNPKIEEPTTEGFAPGKSEYLEDESTSTSHVWRNEDGTLSVRYTAIPSEANPQTGELDPIEREFENNGRGPSVTGDHGPDIEVAKTADVDQDSPVAEIEINGSNLEIRVGRDQTSDPKEDDPVGRVDRPTNGNKNVDATTTDEGSVIYEDLVDGADVEIFALTDGIRVDFIIETPEDGLGLTQSIDLPRGLTVKQDNGVILILDRQGEAVGSWAGGLATDANGVQVATDVRLSIQDQQGQRVTAAVEVSREWLESPDRVYPVRIDPTYTIGSGSSRDTWVSPSSTTPQGQTGLLAVGDGPTTRQAFIDFNVGVNPLT